MVNGTHLQMLNIRDSRPSVVGKNYSRRTMAEDGQPGWTLSEFWTTCYIATRTLNSTSNLYFIWAWISIHQDATSSAFILIEFTHVFCQRWKMSNHDISGTSKCRRLPRSIVACFPRISEHVGDKFRLRLRRPRINTVYIISSWCMNSFSSYNRGIIL